MLNKLHLRNFRCFSEHTVFFRSTCIVVGPNNAGKSTLVEALRLLSVVVSRSSSLTYKDPPEWTELPLVCKGVMPSLRGIDFNSKSVFHRYSSPPARILAEFEGDKSVEIFIGYEGQVFAVLRGPDGKPISNKSKALNVDFPSVSILPQISPLSKDEVILDPDYVKGASSLSWASLHFRNQLNIFSECFEEFRSLASKTWPGLRVRELTGKSGNPGEPLSLMIQDRDFVAEVAWMGHGLQMWLQTMWFLAKTNGSETIILDEPDVYMHADLQRKLIRLLHSRAKQTIIATHSLEIMAEVSADDILVIDREAKESNYASSVPAVQQVFNRIGGVQNLQLTRLWKSRKCLLVEGKDNIYLKQIQNKLFPKSSLPFDTMPTMSIGGWNGWPYAVGSNLLMKNAVNQDITVYCALDSDFHAPEEIAERKKIAIDKGIELCIWSKKEIENYFLIPNAILRIIRSTARKNKDNLSLEIIESALSLIADSFKDETFDALSSEFLFVNKAGGIATANRRAREIIEISWSTLQTKLDRVSGKKMISRLSEWSQREFGASINIITLLKEIHKDELDFEIRAFTSAVERGTKLN